MADGTEGMEAFPGVPPPVAPREAPGGAELGLPSGEGPDLAGLADRALAFQAYILRRAWGVYYAVWASAFLFFFAFPAIGGATLLGFSWWGPALFIGGYAGISLGAMVATGRIFGRAHGSLRLYRARGLFPARTSPLLPALLLLTVVVGVILLAFAAGGNLVGYMVQDLALGAIILWVFSSLRGSFPRIPPEGFVALGTFAGSILLSAGAFFWTRDAGYFALAWGLATGGWFFSALYALYHAPEEMVVEPHDR